MDTAKTPLLYLLDDGNMVKTIPMQERMTLGGSSSGADISIQMPGNSAVFGMLQKDETKWNYRHSYAGLSVYINDQIKTNSSGTGRVRIGGSEPPSLVSCEIGTGDVLELRKTDGLPAAIFYFTEETGVHNPWARVSLSYSKNTPVSDQKGITDAGDGDAFLTPKGEEFYLLPRGGKEVFLRGRRISGSAALRDLDFFRIGGRCFFYSDGVVHYQNHSVATELSTTFRINHYGGGIKITPSVEKSPAAPSGGGIKITPSVEKFPAAPSGGGIKITPSAEKSPAAPSGGGIKITPAAEKAASGTSKKPTAPPLTPARMLTPESAAEVKAKMERPKVSDSVPVTPAKPVKTPPKSVGGTKTAPVKHKVVRRPGADTLQINIMERSVKSLAHKKVLLKDIRLDVHTGEMVLILGGSGAGKTTFMNAVMGYEPAKGTISFRNLDVYRDYEQMKYMIGFVPQQDLMRDNDTVYETLKNAGEMKLPAATTPAQLEKRVVEVLGLLGLEAERENLVKNLSGGQRKRLSIAQEYIGDPTLFFLDEPDSGLDGITAKDLMHNLRTIADAQKVVMLISHQPDRTSELFDKVIVLAKSEKEICGKLAFYGSVEETKAFFGVERLEDLLKKINRKEEGGEGLADYYAEKFERERK